MSVLNELCRLSAAEDIFRYLEVDYDAQVLNVARLHILKRMGEYLAKEAATNLDDQELRARCRKHLETAYADFLMRSPIQERVFKVHKDAVRDVEPKTPKSTFVPLSLLKTE